MNEEIKKLDIALERFKNAMKERLYQKAKNAKFTGWDKPSDFTEMDFVWEIFNRIIQMIKQPKYITEKICIDIANFAMFIYHRITN